MLKNVVRAWRSFPLFFASVCLAAAALVILQAYFDGRVAAMKSLIASFNLESVLYSQIELDDVGGRGADPSAPLKPDELRYLKQLNFVQELFPYQSSRRTIQIGDRSWENYRTTIADPDLLKALGYALSAGNLPERLTRKEIVLTEAAAKRFFGRTDVAGESLLLTAPGQDSEPMRVKAVLADRKSGLAHFEDFVFLDKASNDFLKAGFRVLPTDVVVLLREPEQAGAALAHLSEFFANKNASHGSFQQFVHPGSAWLPSDASLERLNSLQRWLSGAALVILTGALLLRTVLRLGSVRREAALRICFGATGKRLWQTHVIPELAAAVAALAIGILLGMLTTSAWQGRVPFLSSAVVTLALAGGLLFSLAMPYLGLELRRPMTVLRRYSVTS